MAEVGGFTAIYVMNTCKMNIPNIGQLIKLLLFPLVHSKSWVGELFMLCFVATHQVMFSV